MPHSASADMDNATSTSPQQSHSSDDGDSLLGPLDAVADFDPGNPSHRRLLAAQVDAETDDEHSDMTELGASDLHAALISNNEWATHFLNLQAEPWDRAMNIYKLLEMERRDMLEQLYNERMMNITITNGAIEMKVELRRNEPLSEHIYDYVDEYYLDGEILRDYPVLWPATGANWHSAFYWHELGF